MMWITAFLCLCLSTIIRSQYDIRMPPSIIKGPVTNFMYRSDDHISLVCKAYGIPAVSYEWKKNGFDLNLNSGNIQHDGDGSFTIKEAVKLDEGYYQCLAMNQYGIAVTNTSYVQSAVLDRYPVIPNVAQKEVIFGQPFRIEAYPPRSIPKPEYGWEMALSVVDKTPEGIILSKRLQIAENGDLYFSYALPEDNIGGKMYKSTTYNKYLDIKVGGSYTNVTVKKVSSNIATFAPTLAFASPAQTAAVEGDEVSLRCFFSGYPDPVIQWRGPKNNLPIGRHIFLNFQTELIIKNIEKTDEGDYVCAGSNAQGTNQYTLQIRVEAKPVFLTEIDSPRDMNFTDGKTATINCNPYAKPEASILWLRNGQPLDPNNLPPRFIMSKDKKLLTIRDLCRDCKDRPDSGQSDLAVIQCNASNLHGYAFGAGYINVLTPTKVTILGEKEVKVDENEERKIQFECTATSDPITPTTIRWYKVGSSGDELLQDSPPFIRVKDGVLTIQVYSNGTRSWRTYSGTYKCLGFNHNSQAVDIAHIICNSVGPPVVERDGFATYWWILLLVLILLLIIIICCICYCSKQTKGDINNEAKKLENNTRQPTEPRESCYEEIPLDINPGYEAFSPQLVDDSTYETVPVDPYESLRLTAEQE